MLTVLVFQLGLAAMITGNVKNSLVRSYHHM